MAGLILVLGLAIRVTEGTSQGGGLPKFGMKGIFYPGFRVNVANSGVAPFRKGGLSDPYVTN